MIYDIYIDIYRVKDIYSSVNILVSNYFIILIN